jgi:hypothetical protein
MLAGGGDRADWVRNLRREPAVTVRISGEKLKGTARLVEAVRGGQAGPAAPGRKVRAEPRQPLRLAPQGPAGSGGPGVTSSVAAARRRRDGRGLVGWAGPDRDVSGAYGPQARNRGRYLRPRPGRLFLILRPDPPAAAPAKRSFDLEIRRTA